MFPNALGRTLRLAGVVLFFGDRSLPVIGQPNESTFDVVTRGKSCTTNKADRGQLECTYRVGKNLRFSIAGVGTTDAGIVFEKSDIDGDFYGVYGLQHGCVAVWPGSASITRRDRPRKAIDLAFVSPKNGNVYHDWPACGRG